MVFGRQTFPIWTGLSPWLDCRIPGHFIYMSLHKKATIVIYLILQSTPTRVNEVVGYSVIAPSFFFPFPR